MPPGKHELTDQKYQTLDQIISTKHTPYRHAERARESERERKREHTTKELLKQKAQ